VRIVDPRVGNVFEADVMRAVIDRGFHALLRFSPRKRTRSA
jgi:hypothetical protein